MEFTVQKADLVRELGLSQGVVEKKTTIPILSNVLLEASGDRLSLTATDLELGIRCSCPAKVKKEGSGTVPAKKLLDYVRLLPDGELTLKFLDNHWASITCGRSRTKMAGMSRESFPELPPMPEATAELPAPLLASMITKTIFAISAEESRFTLNGALLVIREDEGAAPVSVMVSTDGHRLAYIEHTGEVPPPKEAVRVLIPRKCMAELVRLAQEAGPESRVNLAGDDNHLFFQIGARLLITRRLAGNFPDFERVLPRDNTQVATLDREDIKAAVERVAQFADERSRAIRILFSANEVKVFTSSTDTGESEELVPSTYSGPDIDIGFNAAYLIDFLRAVSQDQVSFQLKDHKSAGELCPVGDPASFRYRYVVMPMRI
ncbi:MAG: DNA polymerase III subunit beta [Bryobacterales bacterium]|nr:DNA polymerase III subunit beta [Bryobacterales bacterium]